jgi:hypothetical protein
VTTCLLGGGVLGLMLRPLPVIGVSLIAWVLDRLP